MLHGLRSVLGWIVSLSLLAAAGIWMGAFAGDKAFESVDYKQVKISREPLGIDEINKILPSIQSDVAAMNLRLITAEGEIIDIAAIIERIEIQAQEDLK
jgi:hypothetical protein